MKHLALTLALLVLCLFVKSQSLSLADLQFVCKKNSWESVNQYLINRGWEYYDSEKETPEKYGAISWSYNKSYNGKAEGWLHLLISEEVPSKVTYLMFNQPAYLKIQNAVGRYGYKSTGSEIDDDEITSTYSSSSYMLEIATLKRDNVTHFAFAISTLVMKHFS